MAPPVSPGPTGGRVCAARAGTTGAGTAHAHHALRRAPRLAAHRRPPCSPPPLVGAAAADAPAPALPRPLLQERSATVCHRTLCHKVAHICESVCHLLEDLTEQAIVGTDLNGRDVVRLAAMPKTAVMHAQVGGACRRVLGNAAGGAGGCGAAGSACWPGRAPPFWAAGRVLWRGRRQRGTLRDVAGGCPTLRPRPSCVSPPACPQGLAFLIKRRRGLIFSVTHERVVLIRKSTQADGSVVWSAPVFLRGRSFGLGLTGGAGGGACC